MSGWIRCGRVVTGALCAQLLVANITVSLFAEDRVLFSFDGDRKLSADWSAVGGISVRREPAPEFGQAGPLVPVDNGATVETPGDAGLFAKSGTIPMNWEDFESVSFWLYRSSDEAKQRPQSVLEVQIYEPQGKARFWRKVEVKHTGWKEYSLPLRWFRWGPGKRPRWDRADRFGFWFRDEANVSIDTVRITNRNQKKAAYFSNSELLNAAFPGAGDAATVTETEKAVLLMDTDLPDSITLITHLEKVTDAIRADFPFMDTPVRRPMLVVFETRQQYENFSPEFAKNFHSTAAVPKSTGFTFHGIATSFRNEARDAVRPTFTHEFVHSYLAQAARISNDGEWLQEGLASMYQIRFHPQEDLREIIQEGLENENYRAAFSSLCNGERIPSNRYWQALTLMEMLCRSEPYRDQFPALIKALQNAKTTNLEPHLKPVLNTTWDGLTADWMEFCRAQYISRPPDAR